MSLIVLWDFIATIIQILLTLYKRIKFYSLPLLKFYISITKWAIHQPGHTTLLIQVLDKNNANLSILLKNSRKCFTSSTTIFLSYSIEFSAEAFRKLAANFILATNPTLLVARSWMLETFYSTNPNKLNNFFFQYQLYFHANPA